MANGEWNQSVVVRSEGEEEEKWLMHYSSFHQILLVGEGDFSFSLCLAKAFGSASNIVASSLDSYDALIINYKEAKSNLENLEKLGATLLHGVDVTKMKYHADLRMRKFDRIIYNFPHAGFHGKEDKFQLVAMHRALVHGFFKSARSMLRPYGEIHVSHKTTPPFCYWNIPELASSNFLTFIDCVDFRIEDFPGYRNKRGAGPKCDDPFPLGECSTLKFIVTPSVLKMSKVRNQNSACGRFQGSEGIPIHIQRHPPSFDWQPSSSCPVYHTSIPEHSGESLNMNTVQECSSIFGEYMTQAQMTFGQTDNDVAYHTREALELGFERYMAGDSRRSLSGYIHILEELYRLSSLRKEWLQSMYTIYQ